MAPRTPAPLLARIAGALAFAAAGCATGGANRAPSEPIVLAPADFAGRPRAIVHDVAFVEQPLRLCGPTALAMAAGFARAGTRLPDVAAATLTPSASGTFKQDLLAAARRLGLAPYLVGSPAGIVAALADGHPVILFHETRFFGKTYWHYSVVTGYDRDSGDFTVHIGKDAHRRMDMEDLLEGWARGGKWSAVVVAPGTLPEFAGAESAIGNGLAFLRLGLPEAAEAQAAAIRARWPERAESDLIRAEARFAEGDRAAGLRALGEAARKRPGDRALRRKLAELRAARN